MRNATLIFILASFLLLVGSRLALAAWQWRRVRKAGGLRPLLWGGLRIDAHQIAVLVALPAVLSPWLAHIPAAAVATGIWLQVCWVVLGFLEIATPAFIQEYDTRPNRLFVEYLKHPREVSGMLWRGYKRELAGALVALIVLVVIGHALFSNPPVEARWSWWLMPVGSLAILAAVILAIRGTLGHRPINPSTVAYSNDGLLNALALNSLYNVFYAIYSMKHEKSAGAVYGRMPGERMQEIALTCAGLPYPPAIATHPSVHVQAPTRQRSRPANIVIILEESLGAQYSAALGGAQDLTPHLDALARQGWAFTRAYATGTRSVRGLEAVTAGFLPTPAQAVLKLPAAQRGFFTLAAGLAGHGYHSRFIYGGESHFDNMKGFFLGNGFDEIVDLPDFKNPAFVGTWGASDEDMFTQLDAKLRADVESNTPSFTLAFSVSNHSPWEYPAGRISVQGNPATVENTVRYADWALGQFFERARQAPYWEDTIFLIVADHDSRVFGDTLIPVTHFHIPAVILGADIEARRDDSIISQIDLPPTLLSLAGVSCTHPMLGHDLTRSTPNRAIMQYENNYGYMKGDDLLVLLPGKPAVQFRYSMPETFEPASVNPALAEEALAHALWPSWAYRETRYCVPVDN
ncbi:LTA synthase family protein [Bordetella sp. 02P26C-1]|uniref:LTA synthase family protein n=1 Tax=Bordetella sp. 02P26C-1 TaxID=2683195 RepID=UPI0013547BC0|nr:LTA synthase family protein [Bordetella sp. 02P26C-1]MVW78516.1 sulfatase-like hydrolase/transferase [Bordetella sp. 02P26C-1]